MNPRLSLTAAEAEFDHLIRIMSGAGLTLPLGQSPAGRTALSNFEAHIGSVYERPGCFAYVGWVNAPSPAEQACIQGAFAQAAAASGVFLGALEPNEGFGLATWRKPTNAPAHAFDSSYQAMLTTIAYAQYLLRDRRRTRAWHHTRIALGCGRIRGTAVFTQRQPRHLILDGPAAVASLYGEIPNHCGGIAKGKDPMVKNTAWWKIGGLDHVFVYRQPWTYFCLTGTPDRQARVWRGAESMPHKLLTREPVAPRKPPADALRTYLIALSLDFSNSSYEFAENAHLARSVVHQLLTAFETMVAGDRHWFVSPRYGDGVAAVIVVDAPSQVAVMNQRWRARLRRFCVNANKTLKTCGKLGLRIGLAVGLDDQACAARLAGIGHAPSAAVEPLAHQIIEKARICHPLSKNQVPPIEVTKIVQWICQATDDLTRVEVVDYQ